MRTKLSLLLGVLVLAAVLVTNSGAPAYAQTTTDAGSVRTLSVTGSGKTYLEPDIVYVSIGVHTENKDAATAVSDNNTRSQKVIDAMKKFSIAAKDMQTTNFSIYPQQQFDQAGKVTGVLYVVDNTVYVTLRNLDKIGDLLDTVVEAGANTINGITFDVADKTKATADARAAAVEDAQSQANELAKLTGVTLGPIMSISTSGITPTPYFEGKGGGAVSAMASNAPISPGQMIVQVDLSVVYSLK